MPLPATTRLGPYEIAAAVVARPGRRLATPQIMPCLYGGTAADGSPGSVKVEH
jgi:hypothetical protein